MRTSPTPTVRPSTTWCEADPRHAVAIDRMRALWGSLDSVPAQPARLALNRAFAPQRARSAQVLGVLGVVFCGWLSLEHLPVWMADQRTGVGERRQIALEDGSQLQLNSNSAVDVKFDGHQRVIELLQGELWVDVAKDAQRPFVVRTDQGTATALGTRYLVKRAPDGTTVVTVIESTVAVKGEVEEGVKVTAGQRSVLDHGRAMPAQAIGNADPDAWTRGLLKVNDQPLSEVLQTLASYRPAWCASTHKRCATCACPACSSWTIRRRPCRPWRITCRSRWSTSPTCWW